MPINWSGIPASRRALIARSACDLSSKMLTIAVCDTLAPLEPRCLGTGVPVVRRFPTDGGCKNVARLARGGRTHSRGSQVTCHRATFASRGADSLVRRRVNSRIYGPPNITRDDVGLRPFACWANATVGHTVASTSLLLLGLCGQILEVVGHDSGGAWFFKST